MELRAEKITFKGTDAVELAAGGYYAVVVPGVGSSVLRFRDNDRDMEIFRYDENVHISEIINAPEIWGLPTLYLPNRFDHGMLRTSDSVYRLPVNEDKFQNHLHGFIQKRAYKIKDIGTDGITAFVRTAYDYDENDFFYSCFPVKFRAEILIELSAEKGLRHTVTLTNKSKVMMPISVATHTTYCAPFVKGANQEDIRLTVPADKKLAFNKKRWLPTERALSLSDYDKEYVNGTKCPVLRDICNDMYTGASAELDGKPFRGTIMTDAASGKKICNEVDDNYKFWIVWNDEGFRNYFCVEPMTAQVNAPNLSLPAEKSGYAEIKPKASYKVSQRFFTIG